MRYVIIVYNHVTPEDDRQCNLSFKRHWTQQNQRRYSFYIKIHDILAIYTDKYTNSCIYVWISIIKNNGV